MIRLLTILALFLIALSSYVSASALLLKARGDKKVFRSFLKKEGLRYLSDYFLFVALTYIIYRALYYFDILKLEASIMIALLIGALYLIIKSPTLKLKELLNKGLMLDLLIVVAIWAFISLAKGEDLYLLASIMPLIPFLCASFTSFEGRDKGFDGYPYPLKDSVLILGKKNDKYLKNALEDLGVMPLVRSGEAKIPYLYLDEDEYQQYQEVDFKILIDMGIKAKTKTKAYVYATSDEEGKLSFGYESSSLPLSDLRYSFNETTFNYHGEMMTSDLRQRRLIALDLLLKELDFATFTQKLVSKKGYLSVGDFEGVPYLDDSKAERISSDLLYFVKQNPHAIFVIEAFIDHNDGLNEIIDQIDHVIAIENNEVHDLGQSLHRAGFDMERFTLVKDLKEALLCFKSRQDEGSYLVLEHISNQATGKQVP